jgi:hypothetical protein
LNKIRENTLRQIDQAMESASVSLVAGRYFECERLCVEALDAAHRSHDYERMSRILLPLQEARRQKRDLARDAGTVTVIDSVLPAPGELKPGFYFVRPPRVGLDGRLLREIGDKAEVPIVVVVREPTTRTGLCPVVALGPVTLRTRVPPPSEPVAPPVARPAGRLSKAKGTPVPSTEASTGRGSKAKAAAIPASTPPVDPDLIVPDPRWLLEANEALGDAAIRDVRPLRSSAALAEELYLRLQSMPDHEKLHQALADACRRALRDGFNGIGPRAGATLSDDDDEDPADEDVLGPV